MITLSKELFIPAILNNLKRAFPKLNFKSGDVQLAESDNIAVLDVIAFLVEKKYITIEQF